MFLFFVKDACINLTPPCHNTKAQKDQPPPINTLIFFSQWNISLASPFLIGYGVLFGFLPMDFITYPQSFAEGSMAWFFLNEMANFVPAINSMPKEQNKTKQKPLSDPSKMNSETTVKTFFLDDDGTKPTNQMSTNGAGKNKKKPEYNQDSSNLASNEHGCRFSVWLRMLIMPFFSLLCLQVIIKTLLPRSNIARCYC
jgi:hypothetical protein